MKHKLKTNTHLLRIKITTQNITAFYTGPYRSTEIVNNYAVETERLRWNFRTENLYRTSNLFTVNSPLLWKFRQHFGSRHTYYTFNASYLSSGYLLCSFLHHLVSSSFLGTHNHTTLYVSKQ